MQAAPTQRELPVVMDWSARRSSHPVICRVSEVLTNLGLEPSGFEAACRGVACVTRMNEIGIR